MGNVDSISTINFEKLAKMCFTFRKFVMQNKLQKLGRFVILLIFIYSLGLQNCQKKPDYLKSYGSEDSATRLLDRPCLKLRVGQKFRLYITSDTSKPEQIKIYYGSNLMDKISLEWIDDYCVIEDKNNFNWVRSFKVQPICTLNIHKINALDIQGAAAVTFLDTVFTDRVDVLMNSVENQKLLLHCGNLYGNGLNAGHVEMAGQGTIFAWGCENGSSFDASHLRSDDAYVYHYAARDVRVNPKNILEATVYGTGNIVYYRDPLVKLGKKELGKGRVVKQ
jgi:Putative auto-transporter adhesin, head GIN domain